MRHPRCKAPHSSWHRKNQGSQHDDDDDCRIVKPRRTLATRGMTYAGLKTFGPHVRTAEFPSCFCVSNIKMCMGEARLDIWLGDYHTTCMPSGGNDYDANCNLPLHLADLAHAWLTSMPEGCIRDWADVEELFVENFQGTYKRPGNMWDLHLCT